MLLSERDTRCEASLYWVETGRIIGLEFPLRAPLASFSLDLWPTSNLTSVKQALNQGMLGIPQETNV